jgi:hypothetical protein
MVDAALARALLPTLATALALASLVTTARSPVSTMLHIFIMFQYFQLATLPARMAASVSLPIRADASPSGGKVMSVSSHVGCLSFLFLWFDPF